MLVNLFSVFDPVSFFHISLNWVALGFFTVMWSILFPFYVNGSIGVVFFLLLKGMSGLFKDMVGVYGLSLVCSSMVVFFILLVCNLFSLFPYVFTVTAQPAISMGLGVTLWMTFLVMGWVTNRPSMVAHLVPCGCPLVMAPFMVLIELISVLIRPLTLSVRLAANMMAGHLIIGLLSSISVSGVEGFFLSVLLQSVVMVLEVAVSVIQGFVFSALILLYVVESY